MTAEKPARRRSYGRWIVVASLVAAIVVLTVSLTVTRSNSSTLQQVNSNQNTNGDISDPTPSKDDGIADKEEEEDSPIDPIDDIEDDPDKKERDDTRPDDTTMTDGSDNKIEWPELVGVDGETAKQTIEDENPSINVVNVVPEGSLVSQDYREDRVWVYVDEDNKVVETPRIG